MVIYKNSVVMVCGDRATRTSPLGNSYSPIITITNKNKNNKGVFAHSIAGNICQEEIFCYSFQRIEYERHINYEL